MRDSSIQESAIYAVGMGIPGLVVPQEGRVIVSPNIPEINDCSMIAGFRNLIPWPLAIDNDANAFALGENWLGAGKGCANMLGITMGTGVGGGLVLQGRIWQGVAGTAAEIGHLTIEPTGYKCNCGNQGCLETMASANWTVTWVKDKLASGETSSLRGIWETAPETLDAHKINVAAQQGDPLALAAFTRVGRALGQAIANIVHLLGIPMVVIGGNFSLAWDQFIRPLQRELELRLTMFPKEQLHIVPAALGDNAGLLGAGKLAWERSKQSA